MTADPVRLKRYLAEIRKNGAALNRLLEENRLEPDSVPLKAAKYILIELAEAMSGTIQHILAKEEGIAVSGYIDTILKAHDHGLVSPDLFERLKPFFDFRNSLVHRYWTVDDRRLVDNLRAGRQDFDRFADEIEVFLTGR